MKKKILPIFACLIAVVMAFAIGTTTSSGVVYAEDSGDSSETITETTILTKDDYFTDGALWKALVQLVQRDYGGDGATIRAGDLKTATTLDLSDCNIQSLDGLEYLIFSSSLKTVDLSGNKLVEISEAHIDKMLGLENLDVSDNQLETLAIPTTVNLKTLNAKNNALKAIDLSGMKKIDDATPGTADLRVNNFESVADISLPNSATNKISLQLAQNYLTDATVADFAGHTVSLQLQGMHTGASTTNANVYVRLTSDAAGGEYTNLTAKVYYRRDSINFKDTVNIEDNLAATSDADGRLIFPAGKMYVRYFNNDVELAGDEDAGDLYFAHELDVCPKAPTMVVVVDGKKIDYEVGKGINKNFQVAAVTNLEGAKTYITIGGTEYSEGNIANIKLRGTFAVSAYIKYDGLKSPVASILVKNTNSTGITWGLIIFICLVVVILSMIFIVRWFRNGAIVAPLTDKEVRSIENRNKNNMNRK